MEDPTPDSAAGWISSSSQDTHHGGRDATPSVDISIAQESTAQRVPSNGIELQHVSAQPMLVQSNPLTASSSSLYLEDTVPHVLGASTETTAEYVYTDEELSNVRLYGMGLVISLLGFKPQTMRPRLKRNYQGWLRWLHLAWQWGCFIFSWIWSAWILMIHVFSIVRMGIGTDDMRYPVPERIALMALHIVPLVCWIGAFHVLVVNKALQKCVLIFSDREASYRHCHDLVSDLQSRRRSTADVLHEAVSAGPATHAVTAHQMVRHLSDRIAITSIALALVLYLSQLVDLFQGTSSEVDNLDTVLRFASDQSLTDRYFLSVNREAYIVFLIFTGYIQYQMAVIGFGVYLLTGGLILSSAERLARRSASLLEQTRAKPRSDPIQMWVQWYAKNVASLREMLPDLFVTTQYELFIKIQGTLLSVFMAIYSVLLLVEAGKYPGLGVFITAACAFGAIALNLSVTPKFDHYIAVLYSTCSRLLALLPQQPQASPTSKPDRTTSTTSAVGDHLESDVPTLGGAPQEPAPAGADQNHPTAPPPPRSGRHGSTYSTVSVNSRPSTITVAGADGTVVMSDDHGSTFGHAVLRYAHSHSARVLDARPPLALWSPEDRQQQIKDSIQPLQSASSRNVTADLFDSETTSTSFRKLLSMRAEAFDPQHIKHLTAVTFPPRMLSRMMLDAVLIAALFGAVFMVRTVLSWPQCTEIDDLNSAVFLPERGCSSFAKWSSMVDLAAIFGGTFIVFAGFTIGLFGLPKQIRAVVVYIPVTLGLIYFGIMVPIVYDDGATAWTDYVPYISTVGYMLVMAFKLSEIFIGKSFAAESGRTRAPSLVPLHTAPVVPLSSLESSSKASVMDGGAGADPDAGFLNELATLPHSNPSLRYLWQLCCGPIHQFWTDLNTRPRVMFLVRYISIMLVGILAHFASVQLIKRVYLQDEGSRVLIALIYHPIFSSLILTAIRMLSEALLLQLSGRTTLDAHWAPAASSVTLMWAVVLKCLGRSYLVNVSSLETQIVTSILFLMFESTMRISRFIRVRFLWSLVVPWPEAHKRAASWISHPVLLMVDYGLLYAEFIGVLVAFSCTLFVRWWNDLPLNLSIILISLAVQILCELVGAFGSIHMQCLFYGLRFRATLWLGVQKTGHMIWYAALTAWPFVLVVSLMRDVMVNPI